MSPIHSCWLGHPIQSCQLHIVGSPWCPSELLSELILLTAKVSPEYPSLQCPAFGSHSPRHLTSEISVCGHRLLKALSSLGEALYMEILVSPESTEVLMSRTLQDLADISSFPLDPGTATDKYSPIHLFLQLK